MLSEAAQLCGRDAARCRSGSRGRNRRETAHVEFKRAQRGTYARASAACGGRCAWGRCSGGEGGSVASRRAVSTTRSPTMRDTAEFRVNAAPGSANVPKWFAFCRVPAGRGVGSGVCVQWRALLLVPAACLRVDALQTSVPRSVRLRPAQTGVPNRGNRMSFPVSSVMPGGAVPHAPGVARKARVVPGGGTRFCVRGAPRRVEVREYAAARETEESMAIQTSLLPARRDRR